MEIGKIVLTAFFGAFVVLSLMLFFWGGRGVVAMDELVLYQDELGKNIDDLKVRHDKLARTLESLRFDAEVLKLRARAIDYYEYDQKVVRVPGWRHSMAQVYEPGRVFSYRRVYFPEKRYIRGAAVLTGLGLVFLLLAGKTLFRRRRSV